jgi:hypothetical protein
VNGVRTFPYRIGTPIAALWRAIGEKGAFGGARHRARLSPAIILTMTVLLWPHSAIAASHGPFSKFFGNWRGLGEVTSSSGGSDRIGCRATYSASQSGDALAQVLICASDSYRIEIHSDLQAAGHEVHGSWTEASRQLTGSIEGRLVGGTFEGNITGHAFDAALSLHSTGRRQEMTIRPQGTDITEVRVNLSREADK